MNTVWPILIQQCDTAAVNLATNLASDDPEHPRYVLHLTTAAAWRAGSDAAYRVESLDTEGFIHMSTPAQITIPANERYGGRHDLILLIIDSQRLTAPLIVEDSYGSGMAFPHLYGPLNRDAVIATEAYRPGRDGRFEAPTLAALQGLEPY